jgi:uncharacterized protein YjbI with pentapeptide repeats
MANPKHLAILQQGVEKWNEWRAGDQNLRPELRGAQFPRADLNGANFRRTDLRGANLERAELSSDFSMADLTGADLKDAMLRRATLRDATLMDAHGPGADFRRANLAGADLDKAQLDAANFSEADLEGAHFVKAYLRGANFREANLQNVDFTASDLLHVNIQLAALSGTIFSGAHIGATNFANVDLSHAVGLETVNHHGPSPITVGTIYNSRGKIPDAFLRGCGLADEFIAYIGSMVGRPIEFYSCFISYSTKDQEFADRLYADLQNKGVRCWFAPHDIHGGRKIHEQLDEAIRLHDKLLLILSEHSMNSNWVKSEIANARAREEREKKQMLFPITLAPFEDIKQWKLFDADRGIDSAREIREYFIPDFSNWKDHDSYQAAFQRLVRDLKAGASA